MQFLIMPIIIDLSRTLCPSESTTKRSSLVYDVFEDTTQFPSAQSEI